jgi:hypothetical protein
VESDKIKAIVAQVKAVARGEENPETIMGSMIRDMSKSPTFAVAIIQRLKDEGIDLFERDSEQAEAFRAKFRPQVEKLGERELSQIRKISNKLFSS